jgi:hypothetical protein
VLIASMAEVAGPAWRPHHERAWAAALGVVAGAMLEGAAAAELDVAAERAAPPRYPPPGRGLRRAKSSAISSSVTQRTPSSSRTGRSTSARCRAD